MSVLEQLEGFKKEVQTVVDAAMESAKRRLTELQLDHINGPIPVTQVNPSRAGVEKPFPVYMIAGKDHKQIHRGDKGEPGVGIQGPAGRDAVLVVKTDAETNTVKIYDENGDKILATLVPIPGKDGRDGLDSTVPGPKGEPGKDSTVLGPRGETGLRGSDGISPTIKVGAVETVAADQPASVSATGDAHHIVLNFRIPRGAAGVDGAAGKDSIVPGPVGAEGKPGRDGLTEDQIKALVEDQMIQVLNDSQFSDGATKKLFLIDAHMKEVEKNPRETEVARRYHDRIRDIIRGKASGN